MSTSDNTRYELFYFPTPGRGEVIRFLLQYAKVNWSERHPTDWSEEKPNTPFGCLPVLVEHHEDGSEFQLGESHAIERYLARKFGLLGSNDHEAALIDSFSEGWSNLINAMAQRHFGKTDAIKEAGKVNIQTVSEEILKYHEKQLEKNGNGYYVGSKLSLVDILAYNVIQMTKSFDVKISNDGPGFTKLRETIENHPVIGSYAQERRSAHKPM